MREIRLSRLLVCSMRLPDGAVIDIRIRNISAGGLGAKSEHAVHPWQRVEVALPGAGVVAGEIAWARGDQFGMRFVAPIEPAQVTVAIGRRQTDYVVPERFRPSSDFRRPGVKRP
jgi:hypothetical protein